MNVAIVHYHARLGGVTRVIEHAVESLGSTAHCLFFSGEAAQGTTPIQKKIRVVPALGYSTEKKIQPLHLLHRARGAFGGNEPDLWHIHNHSLGRNPALTQEVINLAMAGQKILLQLHDFSEEGHPENYSNLRKLKKRLYPIAPQIHYALNNPRDLHILNDAGIPKENLHLLPSPISTTQRPTPNLKPQTKSPLYVYPCRAIQKKNIGEILLWSALMPNTRFAISLAPKTSADKPSYKGWVALAEELGLNVSFNAGAKISAAEMIAQADALITTSVAENSTLPFLEPWMANKPLVGRNLSEITTEAVAQDIDLSNLYTRLPIPLSSKGWNIEADFFHTLDAQLRSARNAFDLPWSDAILDEAKTKFLFNGTLDFCLLDNALKQTIIRAVHNDPSLLHLTLKSSKALDHNHALIQENYGITYYGEHLTAIYQTLLNANPGSIRYAKSDSILEAFLSPARAVCSF